MSLTAPARRPAPASPAARRAPAPRAPVTEPSRRLGVLAILLSAAGMSLSGLFGRMATPEGAHLGEALTLGRMLVGALGMLVILAVTRRLSGLRVRPSRAVVLGGVFLGLSMATYLSATVLTDLSRAVVLHYLGPLLSVLLARVVLKERVAVADALSLGLSFAGMLLTAGLLGAETGSLTRDDTLGTILGTASGIFYGAALFSYRFRADMPSDARSFWNFAFGAAGTAGMVLLVRPDLSGMSAANWAWAGGFFLVSGLLALGLLVVAGTHLRSAELSGLSFTEVVMASLVGAAVFAEIFTAPMLIGAVLILVGAVVPLILGIRSDRSAVRVVSRSRRGSRQSAGRGDMT